MAIDAHKNFSYSTVATAPSPADSGTSLVVAAGDGTKFPTVPFNCTVWPTGVDPSTTNAEIVRVTNISTDTFTITRAQESSTARSIVVGDQIAATITSKTLTDVEQANLLDGVKADSVAQTVSRGSLIYGNSTPKWDELVVGAANSVLWADGTDVSWSAAPRLANIADTGGTTRITLATSSPQVSITGNLDISGFMAIGNVGSISTSSIINVNHTYTLGNFQIGYGVNNSLVDNGTTGTALGLIGVTGSVSVTRSGGTNVDVEGLFFNASYSVTGAATVSVLRGARVAINITTNNGTLPLVVGYEAQMDSTAGGKAPTDVYAFRMTGTWSGNAPTNFYGYYMPAIGAGTNRYGIYVNNITGGTIADLLHLQGTSIAHLQVKGTGTWTAAANETPVFMAEGATPSLRQLKTKDGAAITGGDLVCVLV